MAEGQRWPHRRTRVLFERQQRDPQDGDGIVTAFRDGEVTLRSNRREEGFTNAVQEIGYQGVRRGDLVIHSMDGFAGAIGVSDSDGKASPVVHCYRPAAGTDARFYAYLLRDLSLRGFVTSLAKGIRERSTAFDSETFRSLIVPYPELSEQRAIADFLDRETARIDALITAKRRMIEVLYEQARSWSIRHVLGDLGGTPDAISPSGFYPGVPAGWKETALRHLDCEVQTGPFGSQLHAEEYVEGGWPVVNPMNLVDGEIVATPTMTVSDDKRDELTRHVLRDGDIVFGRRGEMGRAGLVTSDHTGWLCGTGSLRLRINGGYLVPGYLKLLLGSPPARAFFEISSVGSTMDNLNSEIVLSFPALVPPVGVQREIIIEIERHRRSTDQTTSLLRRQIELLVEHRQALITAAVTGELSIPGVAA